MLKKKLLNLFFYLIIIYSFIVSARLLVENRSLWLDEGMLAKSVSARSFFNLVSSPLELMQTAPVIYLYIVKAITVVFGNSEITLRLFSFISYLSTIALTYILSRRLKVKYPVIPAAAVSSCSILLRYSVEFKPYMCDCAAVLLVMLMYTLYTEKKLSIIGMTASFVFIVWLSNPACFFMAAVIIYELLKNLKKPSKQILSGICVFISFSVYFLFWLYPVIKKGDMTSYWQGQSFPLPTSVSNIRLMLDMLREIILPLGILRLAITLFAVAGFVNNIFRKNSVISVLFIGIIIAVMASALGLYPIEDRLWLFIYPLIIILCFKFLSNLQPVSGIVVSLAVMLSFTGALHYTDTNNIYIPGEELNPIIEFVETRDEFVYVYVHSVPTYLYKTGYKTDSNVMLGKGYFNEYNIDIEIIKKQNSGYIVISHNVPERTSGLFEELSENFDIEVKMNVRDTKLYYFSRKK